MLTKLRTIATHDIGHVVAALVSIASVYTAAVVWLVPAFIPYALGVQTPKGHQHLLCLASLFALRESITLCILSIGSAALCQSLRRRQSVSLRDANVGNLGAVIVIAAGVGLCVALVTSRFFPFTLLYYTAYVDHAGVEYGAIQRFAGAEGAVWGLRIGCVLWGIPVLGHRGRVSAPH